MPVSRHKYTNKEFRQMIRDNKLSGKFREKYDENYTRAKTDQLAKFCERYVIKKNKQSTKKKVKPIINKKKHIEETTTVEEPIDELKKIEVGIAGKPERRLASGEKTLLDEDFDLSDIEDEQEPEPEPEQEPTPEPEPKQEPKEEPKEEPEPKPVMLDGVEFFDLSEMRNDKVVTDPEIKAIKQTNPTGQPKLTNPGKKVKYKKNDEAEKKINLYLGKFPNIDEECKALTFKSSDDKLAYIQGRLGTRTSNDIIKHTFMRVLGSVEYMPYIDEYVYLDGFGEAINEQRDTIGSIIDEIMCEYGDDLDAFTNLKPEYRLMLVILGTVYSTHTSNIPKRHQQAALKILEQQKKMEELRKQQLAVDSQKRAEFERKHRLQQLEEAKKKKEVEEKKQKETEAAKKNLVSQLDNALPKVNEADFRRTGGATSPGEYKGNIEDLINVY